MIVVTGGAGFIGSNIVWGLEDRGLGPVAVCDPLNEDKAPNIAKRTLADVIAPEDLLSYLGRLGDRGVEVRAVIHMGAISATTVTDTDLVMKTNYGLSLDLWDWCTENKAQFIYASSAATYGDGSQGFDDDGSLAALERLRPLNLYGRSKKRFDCEVARRMEAGEASPPQWAGLKFFNVYGPNETHKGGQQSVVAQIYASVARGDPATLFESHNPDFEDGGQLRDFIWVGDCVDVVLWLLANPAVSGLFNCGTGKARTFRALAEAVFKALDREPDIRFVPTPENIRDKYQYFTQAPMERLRRAGFEKDFTSLEVGVATYVRQFLATDNPYR